jgi:hypothetical protein
MVPLALAVTVVIGCSHARTSGPLDIRRTPETDRATRYQLSKADEALLDEVQHACFQFFWEQVGSPACLAKDRLKAPVASIAAVGFQLSSLPIGVERRWITREQGAQRAQTILEALLGRSDNRKFGVYLHFPDMNTAGPSHEGFEVLAGTVDHALFLAGAITAAEYFGGQIASLADRAVGDTDWKAFAIGPNGFLSMGWKPDDPKDLSGPGTLLEWHWWNASDEERLIYVLAAGAPRPEHAVAPDIYYKLARTLKHHDALPPFVVSWPGALFTYVFSHCWIDYRSLGADDPGRLGISAPRVDWFENSRRAVLTQRQRCIELAGTYKSLSADRWGLSACAGRDGYIVPHVQPNLFGRDELFEGTVAPYAAISAIMFTPVESLAALRAFRELKGADGRPLIWRDPKDGGYGFVDSFNLDQQFACDDYVGIDQGPMLLAIENVRTGLIWELFGRNEHVQRALQRLRLAR